MRPSRHGCCRLTPAQYCALVREVLRKQRQKYRQRSRSGCRRRRRRRSRRRSCKPCRRIRRHGKCGRPGPKTTNPFLNFMRVYRRKKCGWPAAKIAVRGAIRWCKMSKRQKLRFYREACMLRKKKLRRRRRRRRCRSRSQKRRSSSRCGSKKRSKSRSRCL